MSWLNKVTDFAGRAEDLLNKIDQNTADALKKQKVGGIGGTPSSSVGAFGRVDSRSSLHNDNLPLDPDTETVLKRPVARSYAASSSGRSHQEKKKDDDELIVYLNDPVRERGSSSRRSSIASHVSAAHAHPTSALYGLSNPMEAVNAVPTETTDEVKAQRADLLRSLHLKESQIAVMCVRLQEAEEAAVRMESRVAELMKENEVLRSDCKTAGISESEFGTTLQRLEEERRRERESAEEREQQYAQRLGRAAQERSDMLKEMQSLRGTIAHLELTAKQHAEEMRLTKYNLEANKQEFDEYKQKAQKILNAKEQLLASVKKSNVEGSEMVANVVEVEELRSEVGLLKEDLQQSQLVIYNLKADIQDLENRLREEQKSACAQREALLQQNHRCLSTANQHREQMERTQLEYDFLQAEMRRQEEAVERKLAEKDVELMKLMEDRKQSRRYEATEAEQRIALMGEKLIAKQTAIERLEGEKRALTLRLERSERAYRQAEAAAVKACAIEMREVGGGFSQRSLPFLERSPSDGRALCVLKSALGLVDVLGLRFASFMRSPIFRMFFFIYCILLHCWVFFVLLTYTPEIHPL